MKKPTKDGVFTKMPNEMFLRIFSYLDFGSVLTARCVTRKWKMLVDTSRTLNFTCHLTDETTSTVVNSTGEYSGIKVHDLLQPVAVASATRGVGRILAITDNIEISGKKINPAELIKIMRFTTRSLKDLSFQRCGKIVMSPILITKWTFACLSKLSIGFNKFPKRWHTRVFQQLSENQASFPSLEHFQVVYGLDHVDQLYATEDIPSVMNLFKNYLAIVQIVVAFRDSLKTVEIIRDEVFRTALVLRVDTSALILNSQRRAEVQNCIEGLESVQLDELHITPLVEEGVFPWVLETSLLRRQQELKSITINRKLCSPRAGTIDMTITLPISPAYFTSVKISLTTFGHAPVDLQFFAGCHNLKTLWLVFYRGVRIGPARQNSLAFSNLEQLPTSITSLHFKSSQQEPIIIHQQSILTRDQIKWIMNNLRNLESFWLQLVAEERIDNVHNPALGIPLLEPINPDNIEQQGDEQNDNDQHYDDQQEAQEAERLVHRVNGELNVHANIDPATFRGLIMLPKLKEMKFDMLKARQLGAMLELGADGNPWVLPMGTNVSLDDIREYVEICEDERTISFQTETTSFFPFAFIELTINKMIPKSGAYFTL